MTLTEKLMENSFFRIGAAIIFTGILSFGVATCVNTVYKLENQADAYLENLYMDSIPYLENK